MCRHKRPNRTPRGANRLFGTNVIEHVRPATVDHAGEKVVCMACATERTMGDAPHKCIEQKATPRNRRAHGQMGGYASEMVERVIMYARLGRGIRISGSPTWRSRSQGVHVDDDGGAGAIDDVVAALGTGPQDVANGDDGLGGVCFGPQQLDVVPPAAGCHIWSAGVGSNCNVCVRRQRPSARYCFRAPTRPCHPRHAG